jgi:Na+-transporting methylmalonyl-CoA/oxaloacetate decarboxylase gamma subunit
LKGESVDQVIGILGQAILVLVGLACVVLLVFLILLTIRGIRRLVRELRTPIMPETDSYIPPSFDRSG